MSAPLPFTQIVGDPTLRDLMDIVKKEIFLSLNCHAVATVKSFDATTQTISATINYAQVHYQRNAQGTYSQNLINYSPLIECPIVNLCGGANYLTFPIAEGDQCLVLFNDRDLDNYFSQISTTQPASSRLHSFQDAIALIFTGNNTIENYSTTHVLLTNGTAKLGYNTSTSKILATNGTSLGTALGNLTTALSSLATALEGVSSSVGDSALVAGLVAAGTALSASISSVSSELSGLLE